MAVNIPVVNAGEKYVYGLGLSNHATNPDEIVTIAAGAARNSTNVNDIVLSAAVNVNNTVSGANGLDTGSVANNTWYAVHLIGDSTAYQSTAGLLSTSSTAPRLPRGYDMFRHIGWICTDATADFLPGAYVGEGKDRWFYAHDPVQVLNGGNSAVFVDVDFNASTPPAMPNLATNVMMDLLYTPNNATDTAAFKVNGSASVAGSLIIGTGVAGAQRISAGIQTDSNATIEYVVTAGDTLSISIIGFQFSI